VEIGKLNVRLSLQSPTTTRDELGQPIPGFAEVAKVWASVRHPNGLEAIKAGAETSVVRASVRIRVRPGVSSGMRLVHIKAAGDVVYNIKAVLPDGQTRDRLDLTCEVVS
jgi:SPP1 family predicted phage head-tail adaptor